MGASTMVQVNPKQYAVKVFTGLGDRFTGTVRLISDAQSGWFDEPPFAEMSDAEITDGADELSVSDLWTQIGMNRQVFNIV